MNYSNYISLDSMRLKETSGNALIKSILQENEMLNTFIKYVLSVPLT